MTTVIIFKEKIIVYFPPEHAVDLKRWNLIMFLRNSAQEHVEALRMIGLMTTHVVVMIQLYI